MADLPLDAGPAAAEERDRGGLAESAMSSSQPQPQPHKTQMGACPEPAMRGKKCRTSWGKAAGPGKPNFESEWVEEVEGYRRVWKEGVAEAGGEAERLLPPGPCPKGLGK